MSVFNSNRRRTPILYTMPDDSMVPAFEPNDHLTVVPTFRAESGDYVLVEVDDKQAIDGKSVYVRQYEETNGIVILKPLNPKYPELKFWKNRGVRLHNILGRVADRMHDTPIGKKK